MTVTISIASPTVTQVKTFLMTILSFVILMMTIIAACTTKKVNFTLLLANGQTIFGVIPMRMQTIWEKLIFSVVTDVFDGADMLSGIRLLDKSASGRENMFRIEIWTKFNSESQPMVQALKTHLETEYIQMMIDDDRTCPLRKVNNDTNPADWLSSFSNNSK